MGRYIISGGNSGIGLEIGRGLVSKGHDVVLLGRDPKKCEAAVQSLGASKATAHSVDLSTHDGVRAAAQKLGDGPVDGLVHAAGMLTLKDVRTADGLHPVFSVNYLSRYHLTRLLTPRLKAARSPAVIIIVASVSLDTQVDFGLFQPGQPFPGMRALPATQIAIFHFGAAFAKEEPNIRVALTNVGLAKTEIMREMPLPMRLGFSVLTPIIGVSTHTAAHNPVQLSTSEGWPSGEYWPKPGKQISQKPALDAAVSAKVLAISRELTGA